MELPSDTAFAVFLAMVSEGDLSPYELALFRHYRFERLKESA